MSLEALRRSENKLFVFGLLLFSYLVQFYLIWLLPIYKWDLPGNLTVYLTRLVSMASSVLLVWALAPQSLKRFAFRINNFPWWVLALSPVALIAPSLLFGDFSKVPILMAIDAIVFSMFIGLDEEFFSRVLVFGILERIGFEFALAGSALLFGLSHIANFFYGGESFNYVIGHVISAAGFGYLMAALMVATGSIWLPVFLHGAIDIRWVVMDPVLNDEIVSGGANWSAVFIHFAINILIARALLAIDRGTFKWPERFNRQLRWLGLVE